MVAKIKEGIVNHVYFIERPSADPNEEILLRKKLLPYISKCFRVEVLKQVKPVNERRFTVLPDTGFYYVVSLAAVFAKNQTKFAFPLVDVFVDEGYPIKRMKRRLDESAICFEEDDVRAFH